MVNKVETGEKDKKITHMEGRKIKRAAKSHAKTVKIRNDESTRAKIQATVIVKLLQEHVLGNRDMTTTQIAAAKILMDKTLPNLAQTDINADVNNKNYVVSSEAMTEDAWLKDNETKDPTHGEQVH